MTTYYSTRATRRRARWRAVLEALGWVLAAAGWYVVALASWAVLGAP